jgi:pyruvate,water dikinase
MTDLRTLADIRPSDADSVGGKGLSLGLLVAAGLPVPPGFCVTTAAHRRLRGRGLAADPALAAVVADAYRSLGGGLVAVRSSATAEDGAAASFAGQQDTFLGVAGEDAVLQAIERCWASLEGERAVAYRRRQGIADEGLAMAVVVQQLVTAEVAGVLFTRDPLDVGGRRMLVEASWGLGESVVSGRVVPDRFHLDRSTGSVVERALGTKAVQRTPHGEEVVPPDRQRVACLTDGQLADLAQLGRKVEALFGGPRDVEWALAGGKLWLLQARPITTGGPREREELRQKEVAQLRAKAEPAGTVWSRFNLSEILPAPTPMTWAVVRRWYMSGAGGFGQSFHDLGYDPDPALNEEGIFDLVCGRPYCNLSREPRLHYRQVPFEHPFEALKRDPRRALYPVPTVNPRRLPWWGWLTFPVAGPWVSFTMLRGALRRGQLAKTFAARFRDEIVPAFRQETEPAWQEDMTRLDDAALVRSFEHWCRRTLVDFARDSLKPTVLAALSRAELQRKLAFVLGAARAEQVAWELMGGVNHDPATMLGSGLRDLALGALSREAFLERFGHRGPDEMELSAPRYRENPDVLGACATPSHVARDEGPSTAERLDAVGRLSADQRVLLLEEVNTLHAYLDLREAAKHHLMHGYALIRRSLVELDRRYHLDGGIFYLTPEELPRLLAGEDFAEVIATRRRQRLLLLGLEVPAVLFSDDLEAIGRPVSVDGAAVLEGIALSPGVAEGPALVLEQPQAVDVPEGYILVCTSTDPSWMPLFLRARALVMETGGALSHGAIVAREYGLPGVAGLPGVLRRIQTGQRVRVDGGQGRVTLL